MIIHQFQGPKSAISLLLFLALSASFGCASNKLVGRWTEITDDLAGFPRNIVAFHNNGDVFLIFRSDYRIESTLAGRYDLRQRRLFFVLPNQDKLVLRYSLINNQLLLKGHYYDFSSKGNHKQERKMLFQRERAGQTSIKFHRLPENVDEALDVLIGIMPPDFLAEFKSRKKEDLIGYHETFGRLIRDEFRLREFNTALLESCADSDLYRRGAKKPINADSASAIIIVKLWERLQKPR